MLYHLFLIAVFLRAALSEYAAPSANHVNAIKELLQDALGEERNFIPTCVRLGFHDCVGDACDGCINLENESNNGLSDVIEFLENLYGETVTVTTTTTHNVKDLLSRADFWQLAANSATELAITRSNRDDATDAMPTDPMVFRWGRADCDNSPSTSDVHEFPKPTMDRTSMMNYFADHYGMNENEVTALMGAHTLGEAQTDASGYRGVWIGGQSTDFNNVYYKYLTGAAAGVSYENRAVDRRDSNGDGDRKWQWQVTDNEGNNLGMMLNTDIELAFDIDVDANSGTTSCAPIETDELGACQATQTASLVQTYAENATAFWEAFKSVYDKLSSHGYASLEEVDLP